MKLVLVVILLLGLVISPVFAQTAGNSQQLTASEAFVKQHEDDGSTIVILSEGSGFSRMCCFTTIWFNDYTTNKNLSSTLFGSVILEQNESFSFVINQPGKYFYTVGSLRGEIIVYDPETECDAVGGCGNPSNPTLSELDPSVRNEIDSIKKGIKNKEIVKESKLQEMESLKILADSIRKEAAAQGRYSDSQNQQLEVLESQIIRLDNDSHMIDKEIKDLQERWQILASGDPTCRAIDSSGECINPDVIEVANATPKWLKTVFKWYDEGQLSEIELLILIKWLINNQILVN